MRVLDLKPVQDTLYRAITSETAPAVRRAVNSADWDVSGDCERPYFRLLIGRNKRRTKSAFVGVYAPCRLCEPCLKARATSWTLRAMSEIVRSERTWMCTMTLDDAHQEKYLAIAMMQQLGKADPWETLSERQRFLAHHDAIGPDLTRYWKRVRYECGSRIRMITVVEPHPERKGHYPHYHALVHEPDENNVVRHKTLESQWWLGMISEFKLVEHPNVAALYVAKYLTKSHGARVRASVRYGQV